jgi:hypothetical protein
MSFRVYPRTLPAVVSTTALLSKAMTRPSFDVDVELV